MRKEPPIYLPCHFGCVFSWAGKVSSKPLGLKNRYDQCLDAVAAVYHSIEKEIHKYRRIRSVTDNVKNERL